MLKSCYCCGASKTCGFQAPTTTSSRYNLLCLASSSIIHPTFSGRSFSISSALGRCLYYMQTLGWTLDIDLIVYITSRLQNVHLCQYLVLSVPGYHRNQAGEFSIPCCTVTQSWMKHSLLSYLCSLPDLTSLICIFGSATHTLLFIW